MKLPLLRDQAAGTKTDLRFDGDDMTVVTEQRVDNILDHNKRLANEWKPGSQIGHTQRHHQKVAEIPAGLYYELVAKLGDPKNNLSAWKRWLNDPDNRFFRSTGGPV